MKKKKDETLKSEITFVKLGDNINGANISHNQFSVISDSQSQIANTIRHSDPQAPTTQPVITKKYKVVKKIFMYIVIFIVCCLVAFLSNKYLGTNFSPN